MSVPVEKPSSNRRLFLEIFLISTNVKGRYGALLTKIIGIYVADVVIFPG